MTGLILAALLSAPALAGSASYSAALTLADGRLRVVETARPLEPGALCGELERELPAKRLRLDGLRRLVPVRVDSVLRGTGAGLAPARWTLARAPRGLILRVAPAAAPPDCAVTLLWESEPLGARREGGDLLSFPLPGPEWAASFGGGNIRLAGPASPARLARRDKSGREEVLAEGAGAVEVPAGLEAGTRLVFLAELPSGTLPAPTRGRTLADNLHAAAGAAGLVLVVLFYALSSWSPWPALAAGGALSAGTVAAMRLAEDPAGIGPSAAGAALGAGAGAALAGAAVLGLWALTALLTRSAMRPDAPRRAWLGLAAVGLGFLSFGATTWAAELFTRLVRDAAPAALAAGAGHLLVHAAALVLRRR